MKNIFLLFLFSFISTFTFGQFRMVGAVDGSGWTTVNDSTYTGNINFFTDLTGKGYLATSIDSAYQLFTGTEQIYFIDSTWNKTFSSASVRIIERNNTNGQPVGQVQIYVPNPSGTIPQAPFGSTGAVSQIQAAIDSWNARIMPELTSLGRIDSIDIIDSIVIAFDVNGVELMRDTVHGFGQGGGGSGDDVSAFPDGVQLSPTDSIVFVDSLHSVQELIDLFQDSIGVASISYDGSTLTITNKDGTTATTALANVVSGSGAPVGAPGTGQRLYLNQTDSTLYGAIGGAWALLPLGGGITIWEPSTQVVVGTGTGVDSYTNLKYSDATKTFTVAAAKSNQSYVDTIGVSFSRPVVNSITFSTSPNTTNTTGIDYHGIDLTYGSDGTNITNQANLYPFESRATYSGTGAIGRLIPGYFLSKNTSSGTSSSLYGLRILTENSGSGSATIGYGIGIGNPTRSGGGIGTYYGFYQEAISSGTGTSAYGFYSGEVSGSSTNNYGFYSNATSNFMKGLTVGASPFNVNSGALSINTSTKQATWGGYAGATLDGTISRFLGVDASGNMVTTNNTGGVLPAGSNNLTLRHNGTSWVTSAFFYTDALGRSTFAPTTSTLTSGTYESLVHIGQFAPTSGTAGWAAFRLNNTINQTGGANGITNSLLINPTLTSAPNYRGIQIDNSVGHSIYQSSLAASNYFAGKVGIGTSAPARSLHVSFDDTNTTTPNLATRVTATTSGTAAAGFGVTEELALENASGTNVVIASRSAIFSTATAGSESAYLRWSNALNGTVAEKMRLLSTGQFRLPLYTSSSAFTGTTSHFTTQDASGNFLTKDAATFRTELGLNTNYFAQNGNSFATTATLGTNDSNDLAFETKGTTKMTIDTTGLVGIGVDPTIAQLEVKGTGPQLGLRGGLDQAINKIIFQDDGGQTGTIGYPSSGNDNMIFRNETTGGTVNLGTNNVIEMTMSVGGNIDYFDNNQTNINILGADSLGAGTDTPSEVLDVIGNAKIQGLGSTLTSGTSRLQFYNTSSTNSFNFLLDNVDVFSLYNTVGNRLQEWTTTGTNLNGVNDGAFNNIMNLYHNSTTPADDDYQYISWYANDSGGNKTEFARDRTVELNAADGSEDGSREFYYADAGTLKRGLQINPNAITLGNTTQGSIISIMNNTQRDALTPATGMTVYSSDDKINYKYDGARWVGEAQSSVSWDANVAALAGATDTILVEKLGNWSRVDSVVTFSYRFKVGWDFASPIVSFTLDLPIASNFTDADGDVEATVTMTQSDTYTTGLAVTGQRRVIANTTDDKIQIVAEALHNADPGGTAQRYWVTVDGSYKVK